MTDQELKQYCEANPGATLSDYLSTVTLYSDTDEMDEGEYVTLATIHSVKGLEFKTVFVVGMEENIMPVSRAANSEDDLEEERRLMYVAITRAREHLYLTRSKSRYLYGKREMTMPSRFIGELGFESPRSPYESYARRAADSYSSYSRGGYSGYSSYGRKFSRASDSDDFGYYSDLPPEPQKAAPAFNAAAAYKQAARPAAPSAGAKDLSAFKAGVKVRHPKFGEGIIVGTKGQGGALVVNVSFPGLGIKALSAQLAPLTVIE